MLRSCLAFLQVIALCSVSAHAADLTELFGIGAQQIGNAGAGTASPQDASWALMNPASVVDLHRRLDLHFEFIRATFEGEPGGSILASNPFAGELHDSKWIPIPSGGVVWPLDFGTVAMGIYGVQGNRVDYPRSRTTLGLPFHADRRMHQDVIKLPLALGHRFDNGWAIGAAIVPAVSRYRTDSITLNLTPADARYEYDWALGFGVNAGIYRRWEQWSLGASYTTRTAMQNYHDYEHDLNFWGFDLPAEFRAGVAYRPIPKLELLADYKWINWSSINTLGYPSIRGGLGIEDHHILKTGLTWSVNDRWTLRGGVSYGKSPVQDESVFVNILTPATAEWHLATGVSWKIKEHSSIHLALSHVIPHEQTDNGRGDIFSILGKGSSIRYEEESVTLQYTYAF